MNKETLSLTTEGKTDLMLLLKEAPQPGVQLGVSELKESIFEKALSLKGMDQDELNSKICTLLGLWNSTIAMGRDNVTASELEEVVQLLSMSFSLELLVREGKAERLKDGKFRLTEKGIKSVEAMDVAPSAQEGGTND